MRATPAVVTPEQIEMHRIGLPVPVTEKIAALITGRSVKRLQNERLKGVGLPSLKDGRSVRYLLADCLAAVERHKVETAGS